MTGAVGGVRNVDARSHDSTPGDTPGTGGFLSEHPERRTFEPVFARLVATAGIVGVGTALGAILIDGTSDTSESSETNERAPGLWRRSPTAIRSTGSINELASASTPTTRADSSDEWTARPASFRRRGAVASRTVYASGRRH